MSAAVDVLRRKVEHRARRGGVALEHCTAKDLLREVELLHEALANPGEELRRAYELLLDADRVARQRKDRFGLCDCVDRQGQPYPSQFAADVLERARLALGRPENG